MLTSYGPLAAASAPEPPVVVQASMQPLLHVNRTAVEQQLSRYGSLGSIVQDPAGRLWLASRNGLLRYDGVQVERFASNNSGLANNLITDLDNSDPSALWLLTYNLQLQKMDYQTLRFQTLDLSAALSTQRFNVARFHGTANRIWLLGSNRIRFVERDNLTLHSIGPPLDGLVNRYGTVTGSDPNQPDLWVLTDQGQLYRWQSATAQLTPVLRLAAAEPVEAMLVVADKIYLLQNKKLLELDPQLQQSRLLLDCRTLHQNAHPFYLAYENQQLWLSGPDTGLIRYQLTTAKAHRFTAVPGLSNALTDNHTSVLYVDGLENLWVGTVDAGLARISLRHHESQGFALADPQPGNHAVRPLLSLPDDSLLLADSQFKVWRWHPKSEQLTALAPDIRAYSARQMKDGRVILLGNAGFYLLDAALKPLNWQPLALLQQQTYQSINAAYLEPSNQYLYLATFYGLVQVDLTTGAQQHFPLPLDNQLITIVNIAPAAKGKLWLLTRSDGLLQLTPSQGEWQRFDTSHLPGSTYFDFTTDAQQRLWFASDQGAFRLTQSGDQLQLDSPVLGITPFHSEIRTVHLSADGQIWLHNSEQIMAYRDEQWQAHTIQASQGLLTPLPAKQMLSHQHLLYSGSVSGLNQILPEQLAHRKPPLLALAFSKLSTLERQIELSSLAPAQLLELSYDERQFRLQLAGFASVDLSTLRFQLRIPGQQEGWGPITAQPQFDLYNLPIGQHQLQVRWIWPDNQVSEQQLQLQLLIHPPWWRTGLAYSGYSLLLLLLAGLLYQDWRCRQQTKASYLAQLQEKEQQLRMALWGSGDELWDWHIPQQLMLRQNCLAQLQSPAKTTAFDLAQRLDQIHPDDRPQVQLLLEQHLRGESQFYQASYRLQTGTAQWLWVLDRGKITARDPKQQPLRFSGTLQVIEQLKAAEQALTQLNDQLEQLVAHRTNELAQSNQQLRDTIRQLQDTRVELLEVEKMASLGTMVAGLAHELNTPLGVAVTSVSSVDDLVRQQQQLRANQQLSAQFFDQSQQQIQQGCQIATQNLQRMAQLITVFKKLAVNLSGESKIRLAIAPLWQSLLNQQQAQIQSRQFSIHTEIEPDLQIDTYHSAISEILHELLANSLQHAQLNGQPGQIRLQIWLQDNSCHIRYQDNGKAISRALRSQMFDPFTTSSRQQGHVGLGLSLMYNLVCQLLHGSIRYQSDEHSGWFEIRFICRSEDETVVTAQGGQQQAY
jgi:ligand-binding sensor domain-containing protein/signal transduction histidine kinase